jgi:hypothetical protein
MIEQTAEYKRLQSHSKRVANWKKWGPYLSERAWGTVREDYSPDGKAWDFFTHDHARSRAYRWNEDGIGGISDRNQYLCFAIALWNGQDPILKERFFGLGGHQGNHGEDVKEYYFYLDNTPTHSYMKMLYKYPQKAFPYDKLVEQNRQRSFKEREYELLDTGIFDESRYFDILIEYGKIEQEELIIRISATNRGPDAAELYFIPTLWFRNTWSWGYPEGPMGDVSKKPSMHRADGRIHIHHPSLGDYYFYANENPEFIFTENETNNERLFNSPNSQPYVKDAFHRYIIEKEQGCINPRHEGTKAAAVYCETIASGATKTFLLRLSKLKLDTPFANFNPLFEWRKEEADEYYAALQNPSLAEEERKIQRQAFAGMLWSKQLYYFDIEQWLAGDPGPFPSPPGERLQGRNKDWEHLVNFDILSMPDKWEYPWYASWDLAFHCIPLVLIDPDLAKRQITLMTREWYMHPNGQLPAYEWELSDVNPPVLAWAAWRTYKIDAKQEEKPDVEFLKGIFNKLLLNFTWWVNRKDKDGKNIFQGGFLGLDNISLFDRSKPLPFGGHIYQSDATAWMAFYCTTMMKISLELSKFEPIYQDTATKFFEHFLRIAGAMNDTGTRGISLWDPTDGFYYDALHLPEGTVIPLKVRSVVGLMPLLAVETLEPEPIKKTPIFEKRVEWFVSKKPKIASTMACMFTPGSGARRLMSILPKEKLLSVLSYMLDENEFLSPYGIRSLSKFHKDHPYIFRADGMEYHISYNPAESENGLFGGNSNWRGPIWFPINFLIVEALQKYHHYYGDELKVDFPTGSGNKLNLKEIATEISCRLIRIFKRNDQGFLPVYGDQKIFQEDPHWKDLLLFYEYFHGDTGMGLGASHQTGWTGLIAKLIQQAGGKV